MLVKLAFWQVCNNNGLYLYGMATTDIFSTFMRSFHKFCTQFSFDTYALIYFYDMDQKKTLLSFMCINPLLFLLGKKYYY